MSRQVSPKNVIGRNRKIREIWKVLDRSSALFTAERRIGKTTVMKKMAAEAPESFCPVFIDLEKVDGPVRFVETLLSKGANLQSAKNRVGGSIRSIVDKLGGVEIAGVLKIPEQNEHDWQAILEKALAAICEHQNDKRVILLLDELPYMLQKIVARERARGTDDRAALTILDTLRAMRGEYPNLRMVYTGSVGLHHVVDEIRGIEYASEPLNDMVAVDIGPLDDDDARTLAIGLIRDEKIQCRSLDSVVATLVRLTDAIPFYIERVITRLALEDGEIIEQTVKQEVQRLLTSDHDPWEMEHFRKRLKIYYSGFVDDQARDPVPLHRIAAVLLDHIAACSTPQSIDESYTGLKARIALDDRDCIVQMLRLLAKDHYLQTDLQKRYSFRFSLVARWWRLAQGYNR